MGAEEEAVYEVEDLLDFKLQNGKPHYLVKWQGFAETTWEPDENIGSELDKLKEALRKRRSNGAVKEKDSKKSKKDKEKEKEKEKDRGKDKDRKGRRRRDSSEEDDRKRRRKRDDSGSDDDRRRRRKDEPKKDESKKKKPDPEDDDYSESSEDQKKKKKDKKEKKDAAAPGPPGVPGHPSQMTDEQRKAYEAWSAQASQHQQQWAQYHQQMQQWQYAQYMQQQHAQYAAQQQQAMIKKQEEDRRREDDDRRRRYEEDDGRRRRQQNIAKSEIQKVLLKVRCAQPENWEEVQLELTDVLDRYTDQLGPLKHEVLREKDQAYAQGKMSVDKIESLRKNFQEKQIANAHKVQVKAGFAGKIQVSGALPVGPVPALQAAGLQGPPPTFSKAKGPAVTPPSAEVAMSVAFAKGGKAAAAPPAMSPLSGGTSFSKASPAGPPGEAPSAAAWPKVPEGGLSKAAAKAQAADSQTPKAPPA